MGHVDGIVCVDQKGNVIRHLLLVSIEEFFEGLHLLHIAGLDTDLLTLIHTIGKYQFQRTAHVKESSVMPAAGLAGALRLYAADDIVFSGIL